MIHTNCTLVTPLLRNSVMTRRHASMKSLLEPFAMFPANSGSWLKVNQTGSPIARTRSIHVTIWE